MTIKMTVGDKVTLYDDLHNVYEIKEIEGDRAYINYWNLDKLLPGRPKDVPLADLDFFPIGYNDKSYWSVGELVVTRHDPCTPRIVIDSWIQYRSAGTRDIDGIREFDDLVMIRHVDRSQPPETVEAHELLNIQNRNESPLFGELTIVEHRPGWEVRSYSNLGDLALDRWHSVSPILPFKAALHWRDELLELDIDSISEFNLHLKFMAEEIHGEGRWKWHEKELIKRLNEHNAPLSTLQKIRLYLEYKRELMGVTKAWADSIKEVVG